MYIEKLNTTVSLNQHHSHLIYGSQYPLKWRELSLAWLIWKKNQLPRSIIEGVTQWVCEQVPPSNEGNALDVWIGNRWECLVSILSLLVVL